MDKEDEWFTHKINTTWPLKLPRDWQLYNLERSPSVSAPFLLKCE